MIRTNHVGVDDSRGIVREIHIFAGTAREDLRGRRAKVDDIISSDANGNWSTIIGKAVGNFVSSMPCISWTTDTHIPVIHAPLRSGTSNGMA